MITAKRGRVSFLKGRTPSRTTRFQQMALYMGHPYKLLWLGGGRKLGVDLGSDRRKNRECMGSKCTVQIFQRKNKQVNKCIFLIWTTKF